MESPIGGDHLGHQPGAVIRGPGLGASGDDGIEVPIHGGPESALAQGLAQGPGNPKPVRKEYGPGIWGPPEDGVADAEPGKDSPPVGIDQPRHAQVPAHGEEPVRFPFRHLYVREGGLGVPGIEEIEHHGRQRLPAYRVHLRTNSGNKNHESGIPNPVNQEPRRQTRIKKRGSTENTKDTRCPPGKREARGG